MSSTPSEVQKRPRDEDNSTPSNHPPEPLPAITNDKQFWFEDGNVILVARDARFKVYKGLLAAQSPVFGDLFACASHAEETYEGCPVVRLTDAPEDLKCLLGYLLPTTCVRIPTDLKMDSEDEYKRLATLILLSDKYQIESIGNQALDCLKAAFTNTFEKWDARPEADGLHVRADWQPSTGHRLRAIDVVHLAHITNTPSVLPLAFYHCALLGDKVADGWTREDGTVQRLAPEDLERALGGHKYLCEKTSGFLTSLFRATPSAPCMTRIMCGGLLEVLEEKGADVYKTPALLDRPDGWTFRTPLCRLCTRELEEREKAERRALWKQLPEIFRLGEGVKVWEA